MWNSYEEVKSYIPRYSGSSTEIALETQSVNSLKSLLKVKSTDLDQELIAFINTLLRDIKRYKTLPKFTLRQLKLGKGEKGYTDLINNIKSLRRKLGDNYLDIILSRIDDLDNDVIIAIGNKKKKENNLKLFDDIE